MIVKMFSAAPPGQSALFRKLPRLPAAAAKLQNNCKI